MALVFRAFELLQLVVLVDSGGAFFRRVLALEGAFDYVLKAFFKDERLDVVEVRAAVVVVVVGDHARRKVDGYLVFLDSRRFYQLFRKMFELRREARSTASAAGERDVADAVRVAAVFEESRAVVEAVGAGEAAASLPRYVALYYEYVFYAHLCPSVIEF